MDVRAFGKSVVSAVAAGAALVAFGVADDVRAQDANSRNDTQSVTIFSEIEVTEGAYFAYTESYVALNGDWSRPGLLMRATIGAGPYNYANPDVPGGRVDAVLISGDLMLGYHGSWGKAADWNALIGLGVEDNQLDPNDPSNPVRGSQAGFKIAGEIEAQEQRTFYYHLEGEYTAAYQTYWSRVRIGHNFESSHISSWPGAMGFLVRRTPESVGAATGVTPHSMESAARAIVDMRRQVCSSIFSLFGRGELRLP
jgi:hypothetical protein